jgi:hypothetical protein
LPFLLGHELEPVLLDPLDRELHVGLESLGNGLVQDVEVGGEA